MNTPSKSEIDQLGDILKQPPVSKASLIALDQYRLTFESAIAQVHRALSEQCNIQFSLRSSKSTPSIIAKLVRLPSTRLTQIQDIAGLRGIVKSCAEQDELRDKVVAIYPDCKIQDRREKPSFGYRAVHLIIKLENRLIELQIRTEAQHIWASIAEKLADQLGHGLKYGGGDEMAKQFLSITSDELNKLEQSSSSSKNLAADFTSFVKAKTEELLKAQ